MSATNERVHFYTHDAAGRILSAGRCLRGELGLQVMGLEGVQVREGVADPYGQYRDPATGQILPIPPQPHEGWTWSWASHTWVDARTLEEARAARWEQLRTQRDAHEFAGFEWDGSRLDSDPISQARIQGAVQLAMVSALGDEPFSIDWTLQDNTVRTLSAPDAMAMGVALAQHVGTLHAIGRALREALDAADTLDAIDAIEWPAPPSET